jgi:hypothetical protein
MSGYGRFVAACPERVTIVTSLHPLGRVFDERQAMKIVRTRLGLIPGA